jgi:hypothetical protein
MEMRLMGVTLSLPFGAGKAWYSINPQAGGTGHGDQIQQTA